MTRPLKDRESGQPAKNISLTITEPRLEWLRNLAAARNMSISGAVEFLIDRQRGTVEEVAGDLLERVGLPRPNQGGFVPGITRPSAGQGKGDYAPIPKKGKT